MWIFTGVSGEGASNDSGDVDKAIFSVFVGIALETLDISQRYYRGYAVPRRLFSDPQMHNLE